MNKESWTRYIGSINKYQRKKVKSIEMEFVVDQAETGTVHVTDLQLQEGQHTTAAIPNTSEWFRAKFGTLDETSTGVGNDVYLGDKPKVFSNIQNRFFNIVGRGHEVIVVPNVFEVDFSDYTVPTAVDLTLYTKNDFDLLRISTNYGTAVTDYGEMVYDDEPDHPLNKRYSREFIFDGGGKSGQEIKLLGTKRIATINGRASNLASRTISVGSGKFKIKRQLFMGVPNGSNRIRIEFYKLVNGKMQDTGIGFWGVAEIFQWVEGRSKF